MKHAKALALSASTLLMAGLGFATASPATAYTCEYAWDQYCAAANVGDAYGMTRWAQGTRSCANPSSGGSSGGSGSGSSGGSSGGSAPAVDMCECRG